MTEKIYETYSPEETHALENVWARGKARRCLYAGGRSGRRKDSLHTGIAEGLGITGAGSSPTFYNRAVYEEGRMPFYHFDVYRIGDIEMDEIGEDYFYGDGLCMIEWANLIDEILPERRSEVTIEKDLEMGFDYRRITIREHQEDRK